MSRGRKLPDMGMGKPVQPKKDFDPEKLTPEQKQKIEDEAKRRGWK